MDLKQIDEIHSQVELFLESIYDLKESRINGVEEELSHEIRMKLQYNIMNANIEKISSKKKSAELMSHLEPVFGLICKASGKTRTELIRNSKKRNPEYKEPRQVHIAILRVTFAMSLKDAATKYYGKDHATVFNCIKKVNEWLTTEVEFRDKYREVLEYCYAINKKTAYGLNIDYIIYQS